MIAKINDLKVYSIKNQVILMHFDMFRIIEDTVTTNRNMKKLLEQRKYSI